MISAPIGDKIAVEVAQLDDGDTVDGPYVVVGGLMLPAVQARSVAFAMLEAADLAACTPR